jgi:hypothetical protein
MGARLNNFSLLSSDIRYHINQHWDVQVGFSFSHMSSARYRQPNLGINFVGAHIGFRYFPVSSQPEKVFRQLAPLKNQWLVNVRQGIGMLTRESPGSAATPVYLSSLYLSKRYWSKNKILCGIEYAYNQNVYDFMRLQAINQGNEQSESWNAAIFVGHEFLYGRVGLQLQMAAYLRQTLLPKAPIYQRLGMNWYIRQQEKGLIKNIFVSTLLKTHFATAEFAELGIGIGL